MVLISSGKIDSAFYQQYTHGKPLPVYGRGENVRDWLYVVDHARAIDLIFHQAEQRIHIISVVSMNGRI